MSTLDRITIDPNILGGQPAVRGMRLTVRRVLEMLAVDPDWARLRVEYPELELEDVRQVLQFAARSVSDEVSRRDAA